MGSKGNGITFISAQTSIEGDIQLESTALIAGKLQGKIDSAGQIKIELGGEISGELRCDELRVCGVFRGRACCNKLIIVSSGVVEGEVASHQMEIYEGGQFVGQRIKGPELDALPEMLQALAPTIQRSDAHLYASESRGDNRAIRPWHYAAAAVVIALGFSFGPVSFETATLRQWLPERGNSAATTDVSPASQGLETANGALVLLEPMLTEPITAPDTADAENTAASSTTDTDPLAMSQDAAMEDLQQMEQGHVQLSQQNGVASSANEVTEELSNKL